MRGPVRVLLVVQDLDKNHGGPSESVPRTAIALKEAGAEVGIACYDTGVLSDGTLEAFSRGVKSHIFRFRPSRLNPLAVSLDMARRFEDVARGYDVVITNANWRFPVWWAAHVARKLGRPYIMMPRGSFAPERLKISRWKKRIFGAFDRYAARRATEIWTTAESEAQEAREYIRGARVAVFPMGLEVGKYRARECGPRGRKTLLFMSRISEIKGLDMLAEAWAAARPEGWRLVIAGPDDRGYRAKMERVFARTCEEGSYEFRGPVYGEEKMALLASADAFVLPTRNENWGIAVAEAMASALPVICTMGAPWDIIPEIGAGWRTEISAQGLKRALGEMMEKSDQELYEMGVRGMRWVKENLDWRKVGEEMRERVERLVEGE